MIRGARAGGVTTGRAAHVRRAVAEAIADGRHEARTSGMFMATVQTALALVRIAGTVVTGLAGGRPFRGLGRDCRVGVRRLAGTPLFTVFAVATLAIGIGATTAIYAVIYTTLLKPPAVPNLDRVVEIRHAPRGSGPMMWLSWPDYQDLRASQDVFDRLSATMRINSTTSGGGRARQVFGEAVTGGYFDVLGLRPVAGRLLGAADDLAGGPRAAVVSERLWDRLFDRQATAVGQDLTIDGNRFTLVGVVPASYRGGEINSTILPSDVWVPLEAWLALPASAGQIDRTDRDARRIDVKARLAEGRTIDQARAVVQSIAARLDETVPIGRDLPRNLRSRIDTSRPWAVIPIRETGLAEQGVVRGLAWTAMAAVCLVLLVACTNLANLLLARGSARRAECGVRLALGASRWRVVRESLVESAGLAVVGGGLGLLLARGLTIWLTRDLPFSASVTVSVAPALDPVVVLLAFGATVLSLVVFGLGPAWLLARADVRDVIVGEGGSNVAPRWRGRRWLIAGQVTVSVVLAMLAALAAQQAIAMLGEDTGVELRRLAAVTVILDDSSAARGRAALVEAARQLPDVAGVQAAAVTSGLPIGQSPGATVSVPAGGAIGAELVAATPGVFRAFNTPILAGRGFDARDSEAAERVVVLGQHVARTLFGDTNPLGQPVEMQRRRFVGEREHPVHRLTVIGIADDSGDPAGRPVRAVYLPIAQQPETRLWLVALAERDPAELLQPMRETLSRVAPDLAVAATGTGVQLARPEHMFLAVTAGLASWMATLAAVLSMVGLFGVLAHVVARRTREIGIRLSLGASAREVVRLVVREGMSPVIVGVAAGTAVGVMGRFAARPAFLRPLPAVDLTTVTLVAAGMVAAGLLACYGPARRASRVDPNVALRRL